MFNLRKIPTVILIFVFCVSLITGCNGVGKKDWLFACDPGNMLGLKGYYYLDGDLCIVFDNYQIKDQEHPECGLEYVLREGEWRSHRPVSVWIKDSDPYRIDAEDVNIDINGRELIMSFAMDEDDADDIIGLSMDAGGYYTVDLEEGIMKVEFSGGEVIDYYTQSYDPDHDRWSGIEYEQCFYPMTDGEGNPV
ncbi:MAG: hypothetical protein J5685_08250 [Clostridiales bacterium]|nr:hypothetical protein [Clostridiales bacterium]